MLFVRGDSVVLVRSTSACAPVWPTFTAADCVFPPRRSHRLHDSLRRSRVPLIPDCCVESGAFTERYTSPWRGTLRGGKQRLRVRRKKKGARGQKWSNDVATAADVTFSAPPTLLESVKRRDRGDVALLLLLAGCSSSMEMQVAS